MYEDTYDLTDSEKLQVQEILAEITLRGGRLTDAGGRPVAYRILRGRRFLVCDRGLVWRFAPEGSPQVPGQAVGVVRRNNAVEMWTGKWRKVKAADGRDTYAKCLVWVPLDDNINGHPGISKLGWYRSEKGFKHPLEAPHSPTPEEVGVLEGRAAAMSGAVYARRQAEGLSDSETKDPAPGPEAGADRPRGRGRRRAS